jgi:hypothetical protein
MVRYTGFTVAQCAKGVDLLVLVSQGQVVQSFLAPSATPMQHTTAMDEKAALTCRFVSFADAG